MFIVTKHRIVSKRVCESGVGLERRVVRGSEESNRQLTILKLESDNRGALPCSPIRDEESCHLSVQLELYYELSET